MRILLTGAGGFIGSAVLPILLRAGHDVTILTRPASVETIRQALGPDVPGFSFLPADPEHWAQAVNHNSFEICLHLAWIATPGIYLNSPENETFADCTLALAERLFAQGTRHFIGTGTCVEYSPGLSSPCLEGHTPTSPLSLYGQAKLRTSIKLQSLAESARAGWTWGRVFYPYGVGEHSARTATTFLRTLSSGKPLNLKTGGSLKDWIEISDLAGALVHLTGTPPQGLLNLGTGSATSILELALAAARLTNADPALVLNPGDGIDPYAIHLADPAKLFSTGWKPRIALEDGLERLWRGITASKKIP